MNISLPEALKSFVNKQVSQRGDGISSEYVRELIRKDQDRMHLRGLLLAGAASPPPHPRQMPSISRTHRPNTFAVADGFEKQLLDRLVGETRCFVKGLHYNLGRGDRIASAMLTDCEGSPPMLFIGPQIPANPRRGLRLAPQVTP